MEAFALVPWVVRAFGEWGINTMLRTRRAIVRSHRVLEGRISTLALELGSSPWAHRRCIFDFETHGMGMAGGSGILGPAW